MSTHLLLAVSFWNVSRFFSTILHDALSWALSARNSDHELHIELRPDGRQRVCESSFRRRLHVGRLDHDRSTVASHACSSSSALARKRQMCVGWGEHAVSHHKLAVQFRRQSGRTDIVVLLEQTKQVCQCTLRSVTGKGDTEEQARKNAEELMTNVAKNFATGSIRAQ